MKQFLLLACLSVLSLGLTAQVYVDADATGTADGTTWANAYPSLNDALIASPAGSSLWIADGTYTTPDSASFFINRAINLYGGFNGTETSRDAADPVANVTILSGDVAGNDVVGTFDSLTNVDNNRILLVSDTSTTGSKFIVNIDGLTIANGKLLADDNDRTDATRAPFAGGGILAFAQVRISRVAFTGNRADYGANLAIVGPNGSGSVVEEVTTSGSFSGFFGQFFVDGSDMVTIRDSEFDGEERTLSSGFIAALFADDMTVSGCSFKDLNVGADIGAAFYTFGGDDVVIRDCTMDGIASRRGALFLQQSTNSLAEQTSDDFIIENCVFTNCQASERGAAIATTNANMTIDGCTFTNLIGELAGGGIYYLTSDNRAYNTRIINSTFTDVTLRGTAGAFGGTISLLGRSVGTFTTIEIDSTIFDGGLAPGGQGGAIYADGNNIINASNTTFTGNSGNYGGSIIQRGFVGGTFSNVTFDDNGNNTNTFQGAGIVNYYDDGSPGHTFDSCTFVNNQVTYSGSIVSGGAGIYALGGDAVEVPLTVTNSSFISNSTVDDSDGGAIYLIGGFNFTVDNCNFNANGTSGEGGAIVLQTRVFSRDTVGDVISVVRQPMTASISNSQFVDHIAGTQGGAISTSNAISDLINCVFINNTLGTDGASGGAVIFNGMFPFLDATNPTGFLPQGDLQLEAVLIHNTFVDNLRGPSEAAVGDNLALFQPNYNDFPDSVSMKLTLLNNVFFSSTTDASFEAEPGFGDATAGMPDRPVGNIFLESLGGNFFNGEIGADFSDDLLATDTEDESISDPELIFTDPFDNEDMGRDLSLLIVGEFGADNPLINGGVTNALVPETAINGIPRGDSPDIGAFETALDLTSVNQPIENSGLKLEFFPNPTANVLNIRNTDPTIRTFQVLVSDMTGRVLTGATFNGDVNSLDLSRMAAGVYNLQLIVNGNVYSKQVVKQ